MNYDPADLLHQIDAHTVPIILGCGGAAVFNAVFFIDAFLVARRERLYSLPLVCTFFWFAHDASFVLNFDVWFGTYHHWYVELMWVALGATSAMELVFLRQAVLYGRAELAPWLSPRRFGLLVAGGAGVSLALWEIIKPALHDELYVFSFGLAVIVYPLFGAAMILRRRSRAGQTLRMWIDYTAMSLCWFATTALWYGPTFRSWRWIALGTLSTVAGLVMIWILRRLPTGTTTTSVPYSSRDRSISLGTTDFLALEGHFRGVDDPPPR